MGEGEREICCYKEAAAAAGSWGDLGFFYFEDGL